MENTLGIVLVSVLVFTTSGFFLFRPFRRAVVTALAYFFSVLGQLFTILFLVFERTCDSKATRRQTMIVMRGVANLIFFGLSLWLAYKEFGTGMFKENVFWLLFLLWAYISFSLFWAQWDDSHEESVNDKLDELIVEIRKDRESREGGVHPNAL